MFVDYVVFVVQVWVVFIGDIWLLVVDLCVWIVVLSIGEWYE